MPELLLPRSDGNHTALLNFCGEEIWKGTKAFVFLLQGTPGFLLFLSETEI